MSAEKDQQAPANALFLAIAEKRWQEASSILQGAPKRSKLQAAYINRNGVDTAMALHIACQYDDTPVHIVQKLLELNPEACLFQTGKDGLTPLQIATDKASLAVFSRVLEACPRATAIKTPKGRWVPLHMACIATALRRLEPERIRMLLQADPTQLSTKTGSGLTPLDFFFSSFNRVMREVERDTSAFSRTCHMYRTMMSRGAARTVPYHTACCALISANDLLYTQLHGRWSLAGISDKEWKMVHATLRVSSCPWVFFKFALGAFPEQAREPDTVGHLPLQIAAAAANGDASALAPHDGIYYECHACRKSPIHGTRYHHREYMDVYCSNCTSKFDRPADNYYTVDAANKCASVIEDLLKLYPEAAKRTAPANGRLPLHLAVEAGKTWSTGVQALLKANPASIGVPDPNSNLYPFLTAATVVAIKNNANDEGFLVDDDEEEGARDERRRMYKNLTVHNQSHLMGELETKLVPLDEMSCDAQRLETIFLLMMEDPSVVLKVFGCEEKEEPPLVRTRPRSDGSVRCN